MKRAMIAAAALLLAACGGAGDRDSFARVCIDRGQEVTACVDAAERLYPHEAPQVRR